MRNKKVSTHRIKKGPQKRGVMRHTKFGACGKLTADPRQQIAVHQLHNSDGTIDWQIQFVKPKTSRSLMRGKVRPTCITSQRGVTIRTTLRLSDAATLMLADILAHVCAKE